MVRLRVADAELCRRHLESRWRRVRPNRGCAARLRAHLPLECDSGRLPGCAAPGMWRAVALETARAGRLLVAELVSHGGCTQRWPEWRQRGAGEHDRGGWRETRPATYVEAQQVMGARVSGNQAEQTLSSIEPRSALVSIPASQCVRVQRAAPRARCGLRGCSGVGQGGRWCVRSGGLTR